MNELSRASLLCLLLLLTLCTPARAQLLVNGLVDTRCADTPRVPPLPVPAKVIPTTSELPRELNGSGTRAVIEVNSKGVAAGWWVARSNGQLALYLYAVTWQFLAANPALMAKLVLLGIAPSGDAAQVAAIGAAHSPTLDMRDMCDVWSPMVAALNASKPAIGLSPYIVTPGTPRPAFAVVNGKRSTAPTGAAVPGQPCDCTAIQIIEFNVVRYCASPSITGITGPAVTACTARPK